MQHVQIIEGTYKIRGNDTSVAGMTFPLVEDFKVGAKGGYVTVDGTGIPGFPDRNLKIKVGGPEDPKRSSLEHHLSSLPWSCLVACQSECGCAQ